VSQFDTGGQVQRSAPVFGAFKPWLDGIILLCSVANTRQMCLTVVQEGLTAQCRLKYGFAVGSALSCTDCTIYALTCGDPPSPSLPHPHLGVIMQ
jgi:hypothetical protein